MLLIVLVVVVGPQRLPEYTRKLTQLVRRLRLFLDNAKEQIAEEVGPELGDLNLEDLNPRNYDPRKIVRDALGEDIEAIRKDLANPFESVVSSAKKTSDEAVEAVKEDAAARKSKKSLSRMIDDKARRTREERQAEAARAAQEAEAVTSEIPQVDDADDAGRDQDPAAAQDHEPHPGARTPSGEDPMAEAGTEAVTDELPQVEGQNRTDEVDRSGEGPVADDERRALLGQAIEAVTDAAQAVEDAVDLVPDEIPEAAPPESEHTEPVPSSLVGPPQGGGDSRPVSPRDVLRAARAAARTRTEATTVGVD